MIFINIAPTVSRAYKGKVKIPFPILYATIIKSKTNCKNY